MGRVVVVAPLTEKSAVGHAITLSDPLRVYESAVFPSIEAYAVKGTPADCVKIACWALLKRQPDLIISGINRGSNTGINTIYSGTVSAATEGAILGIPAFAISLTTFVKPDFGAAASFAARMARQCLTQAMPEGVFLNVNVPAIPETEIRGVKVTRQGMAVYRETYDKRIDPHGGSYYWLNGQKVDKETALEVDEGAVQAGYISVTPVHFDLTRHSAIETIAKWSV